MRELGEGFVTLSLQSHQIAIRANAVREVLGARSWVPVPGARKDVPGIVAWGGRAIALVDLAHFQPGALPLAAGEQRARVVVTEGAGCTLALPVDQASEVWRSHHDNLQPRQVHDFQLSRQELVREGDLLPLFEPELLLARLQVELD